MARMLSRMHPSFCPVCCCGPVGPDCPDSGVDKKTQRGREKREWRRTLTRDLPPFVAARLHDNAPVLLAAIWRRGGRGRLAVRLSFGEAPAC